MLISSDAATAAGAAGSGYGRANKGAKRREPSAKTSPVDAVPTGESKRALAPSKRPLVLDRESSNRLAKPPLFEDVEVVNEDDVGPPTPLPLPLLLLDPPSPPNVNGADDVEGTAESADEGTAEVEAATAAMTPKDPVVEGAVGEWDADAAIVELSALLLVQAAELR